MKIFKRIQGAVLLLLAMLLLINYYSFYKKKEQLTSGALAFSIQDSFKEFVLSDNEDVSIGSFLRFFEESHPIEFEEVIFQKWNLGVLVLPDTVKIYEFGFDEEDDKNPEPINLKEFSYWNYLNEDSIDLLISSVPKQKIIIKNLFEEQMDDDLKRFKIISDSMDRYDAESP